MSLSGCAIVVLAGYFCQHTPEAAPDIRDSQKKSDQNLSSFFCGPVLHLNSLEPLDGWFTGHYGGDGEHLISNNGDGLKKPWQKKTPANWTPSAGK
jgi:hypothetical protein